MADRDPDTDLDRDRSKSAPQQLPVFDASALFGAHREVILVHRGAQYRLRLTQSGKLILTK